MQPPLTYEDINGLQKTVSWSVYAQATVPLTPTTRVTGGVRYTDEWQNFFSAVRTIYGLTPFPEVTQSYMRPTWRAAIDQQVVPGMQAYFTYNRGLKSGGFNLLSPGGDGYKPEILDSFEVGLKSEFLQHRLRVNVAAFLYDYKNIQVEVVRDRPSCSRTRPPRR